MKITIIGSGIVGLTIAYTLSKENIDITIFEKERDSLSHGTGRNRVLFTLEFTINLKL